MNSDDDNGFVGFELFFQNYLTQNKIDLECDIFSDDGCKSESQWRKIVQNEYDKQYEMHLESVKQKEFEGLHSVNIIDVDYYKKILEKAEEDADEYNKDSEKYFRVLKKYSEIAEKKYLVPFAKDIHQKLKNLETKYPHCADIIELIDSQVYFQQRTKNGYAKLPTLIFSGPSGSGKSSLAYAIASIITPHQFWLDLSLYSEAFYVSGLELNYTDGGVGIIIKRLSESKFSNNTFILDEVEKSNQRSGRNSPLLPLFGLLERDTAKKFVDVAFQIPIDTSNNSWILTANDLDLIPPPLLNRAIVFKVPQPSKKLVFENIAQSIWDDLLKSEKLEHSYVKELSPEVRKLISSSSIRSAKNRLQLASANCAKRCRNYDPKKKIKLELSDFKINDDNTKNRTIGFIQ